MKIFFGVAAIFFVTGLFVASRNNRNVLLQFEKDTVRITEDGFVPDTLKVKIGSTVTFINATSEYRWPASDFHPSHTLYPEFDPGRPLSPGEKWNFVFDRKGEWGMHDHLAPYIIGKIIVVE